MKAHWTAMENGTHVLTVGNSFLITMHPNEGYAIATGVDLKISLIDGSLEEQQLQVQRTVVSVLLDTVERICPDNKLYGRG